jgi:hypothetical protein
VKTREVFDIPDLAANQAQHHTLILGHCAQRRKIPGARRVVFEQEVGRIERQIERPDHRRPASFVAYVWDEKSQSIKRITEWAKVKDGEPVVAKMTN